MLVKILIKTLKIMNSIKNDTFFQKCLIITIFCGGFLPFSIEIESLTIEFEISDYVLARFNQFCHNDVKSDDEFVSKIQLKSKIITKFYKI